MRYILGVDQGGSKTHAIISDENGNVVGFGHGKGACHSVNGMDASMSAVKEAVTEAISQSEIKVSDIDILVAGMTGVDWDYESQLLKNELKSLFDIQDIVVINDAIIAMRSGTTKKNSAVICAGSGLNCAVKKNKEVFAYGFYIKDENQGGNSLGKKAVQAVFDSHMGLVPETILTEELLDYFNLSTVDELLYKRVMGELDADVYLRLPKIIEECAFKGDEVATSIWSDYGKIMAEYVTARMKKMDMLNEEIDIILSGSILKCKLPQFHEAIREGILSQAPKANICEAIYEPIVGALLLGLDNIYEDELPKEIYANIEKSSNKFDIKRNLGGDN